MAAATTATNSTTKCCFPIACMSMHPPTTGFNHISYVSITAELLAGARALSFADRHHFDLNLSDLLDKSTQCKRNWLLNVIAARQRFERQQADFEGIQTLSIANSKLIKWMTTGRASQRPPSTASSPTPQPLGTAQSPVCRDQRCSIFS